jgi:NAD(P)-dependent dehydrogenase (short-subunit alcohol dehydrogenase family)
MVVVVTGGYGATASGIIQHFKNNSKAVVGTLRNLDSKWKEKDGVYFTKCDLSETDQVEGCVELIRDRLDGPHVWINVVGGFMMGNKVEDCLNEWEKMHQLNFETTLNCIKNILPIMNESGFGRIINFGSRAGEKGMALAGPYAVSKASIHNLTKTIAHEINGDITCNAVLPEIIDTPANREAMPNANFYSWSNPLDIADKIESIIKSTSNGQLIFV